jgi:hypothetical protein
VFAGLLEEVCRGLTKGPSGRLSVASVGCDLAPGSAKSTTKAMKAAANHRVRATWLTSILLYEPLIELVNAGCRSIVNTYPLVDGSNRSEVSAGMPEEHKTA